MKLKIQLLTFIVIFGLVSCGGGDKTEKTEAETPENTAPETEEEETPEETTGESSNPEFGKGITFYMKQYEDKFLKDKIPPEADVKRENNDQAGYAMLSSVSTAGIGEQVIEMGLWVTNDKREILGVFTGMNSGMTSGGEVKDLKFYDTKWNDITGDLIDISALEKLSQETRGESSATVIGQFEAKIPKQGTTIELIDLKDGLKKEKIGELQFDLETGKFKLVQ